MKNIYASLRPLLEPRSAPFLFVIGVILLNLMSNALYDIADPFFRSPLGVFLLAASIFLALILLYALLRRFFAPRLSFGPVTPRKGLIVLVSQGNVDTIPAAAAIEFHRPALQSCWLVVSPKAPFSGESDLTAWKNAQTLVERYQAHLINIHPVVVDPENAEDIFKRVEAIYLQAARYGLRRDEIIADFTGGTKMMTTGLVLACTAAGRDVQYMKPRGYLSDGRADVTKGSEPVRVDLHFWLRAHPETLEAD